MSRFEIVREAAQQGLRFANTRVETKLAGEVAEAFARTETGLTNPLYVLTLGKAGHTGLLKPAFGERVVSKLVDGSRATAFGEAVDGLHAIGTKYGVEGISLTRDPSLYGGIKFADSNLFLSGKPVIDQIGREGAFEIDAAARRVMEFVDAAGDGRITHLS